jgi:hypothetical protein
MFSPRDWWVVSSSSVQTIAASNVNVKIGNGCSFIKSPAFRSDFCLFWTARAIFQQSGGYHYCRWQGCKSRPLLSTLRAFSSEGYITCHTYCDTGPPFLMSYPKDSWLSLLNAVLLAKEKSLPILNVLGLTRPARAGLELTTTRMLIKSTPTRIQQPVI